MFAVVFEDARDSFRGQVDDAVEFCERMETFLQMPFDYHRMYTGHIWFIRATVSLNSAVL